MFTKLHNQSFYKFIDQPLQYRSIFDHKNTFGNIKTEGNNLNKLISDNLSSTMTLGKNTAEKIKNTTQDFAIENALKILLEAEEKTKKMDIDKVEIGVSISIGPCNILFSKSVTKPPE